MDGDDEISRSEAAWEAAEVTIRTVDGLRLVGEAYGDPQSPAILFLHGGGQSRSSWRGAARVLARAGFRSCAMDLRGHGDSDWAGHGAYQLDNYVADLGATIDAVGSPAIVVGASMGGHVATLAAVAYPERVRALVLVDVNPWIDEAIGAEIRSVMREGADGFETVEEAGGLIARLHGTPDRKGLEQGLEKHLREGVDGRLHWRWDVNAIDEEALRVSDGCGRYVDAAKRMRVPTLLMLAQHSNVTRQGKRGLKAALWAEPSTG